MAENDVTAASTELKTEDISENVEEESKETEPDVKQKLKETDKKDYSFLQSKHVFGAFVLSKLSDKDLNFIKQE